MMRFTLVLLFVTLACSSGTAESRTRTGSRPNVLFISIDDLRPELGCYGAKHVRSPNIDRLARRGVVFERAYCQQALCNPSRTSLLTGMRPETVGVVGNQVHFRDKHPKVVTLPEHFKNHGYVSQAIGKVYHGVFPEGASKTPWDTMGDPRSWLTPATRFGPRYYYTPAGIAQAKASYQRMYGAKRPGPDDWQKKLVFGPMTEAPDVDDEVLYDGKVATAAIAAIRKLKDKPFFLAVGFIKPHTPFVAPKKYWDLYDPAAIQLAANATLAEGAPQLAGHNSGEVRRYTDQPKKGVFSEANRKRLMHGYYACISYVDAQVGRVLEEVDRQGLQEKTIVVLYGDHGWHLGEQGLWGKQTTFEVAARAPLIVSAPAMSQGKRSRGLTEFVDIYPTLCELAGLSLPGHVEGESLVPRMRDTQRPGKTAAFTQCPRGKNMGYSLRTERWRYTEWIDRSTREVRARELYDHETDPRETVNVAAGPQHAHLVAKLAKQLHGVFPGARPQPASKPPSTPALKRDADAALTAGFEKLPAGPFTELTGSHGQWQAKSGHATIHTQHRRSGEQCLRLLGGKDHRVLWTPAKTGRAYHRLDFWFERWTRRQPFDFRVEALTGGEWRTLHHDTRKAVVGSFKNHLSLEFGGEVPEKFRFSSTTLPESGVMIDDVRLVVAAPMRLVSVTTRQPVRPVLVRNEVNPVLDIRVEVEGSRAPLAVTRIELTVDATDLGDIEHVEVLAAGSSGTLPARDLEPLAKTATRFGARSRPGASVVIEGRQELIPGTNHFFVSVKLGNTAQPGGQDGVDLSHRLDVRCVAVEIDGKPSRPNPSSPHQKLRFGYAVRKAGDDGSHTYRIPGLVTTRKGTLIAVYDIRRRGGGDLPGDIDVGISRSTEGGRTWEPMRVIMDMGDDPKWRYDGIGDPAVLADQRTGTIWVAATWSHGNRSWHGSGPGLEPEETGQLMLVRSDDDGRTWSAPINITRQVKRPEWCFLLQGPGKGITMRDGTIVFAAQYQDTPANRRLPRSTILYSKDHGQTWRLGKGAFDDTTEAQVVEIRPGELMLNCRYNRASTRVVMTSRDMGETWKEHPTSRRALIEPRSCMASLIDADHELGKNLGGWLLFSNPDSTRRRDRITIKASSDRGRTWPKEHRLLLDEGLGAGYSCLTMIDDATVGILYEGSGAHLTFQRISLREITGGTRDKKKENEKEVRSSPKTGALRLPRVFGDHMVLQAAAELPVWGTTRPGRHVTVSLGEERQAALADGHGNWQVRFPPRPANSEPTTLRVRSAGEEVQFGDVLIGEVWVCAGQSNMEWPLAKSDHAREELKRADRRQIRLLHLRGVARGSSGAYRGEHLARLTAELFCDGAWRAARADSAREFSAVGWYFGRYLEDKLRVPIGLICPAIGGTPAEAWARRETLESDPELRSLARGNWLDNGALSEFCRRRGLQNLLPAIQAGERIPGDDLGPNHSFKPGFMWRAGIEPLIPYAIRGAIWYQGESNAESAARAVEHARLLPLLISDWRAQWKQGAFPFLYVQLPAMRRPYWPLFRDGQRRMLQEIENTGMAVTIDTGHPTNVHPTTKRPIGERLAKWALGTTYGSPSEAVYSGPLMARSESQGSTIVVRFVHVGSGLTTSDGKPPRHFEVSGDGKTFYPATATITGKNAVTVSSPRVALPQRVRYAWLPFPEPPVNLTNSARLPASPFATGASANQRG